MGADSKLGGLKMLPFAILWLITFSLVQCNSILTGTLPLWFPQALKRGSAEETEVKGKHRVSPLG